MQHVMDTMTARPVFVAQCCAVSSVGQNRTGGPLQPLADKIGLTS